MEVHEQLPIIECNIQENEVHEVYAAKVPHIMHHLSFVVKAKAKEHNTLKVFNMYEEIREDRLSPSQKGNVIGKHKPLFNNQLKLGKSICVNQIFFRPSLKDFLHSSLKDSLDKCALSHHVTHAALIIIFMFISDQFFLFL